MKSTWVAAVLFAGASLASAAGCGHAQEGPPSVEAGVATNVDAGALLDPQACARCHADHFNQWSGSMHAFASTDPVFLAMNKRMQRENPALGTFCVKCHAPMAVLEGKTTDGLNLSTLGPEYLGVTCYFCHDIDAVDATQPFNGAVTLAHDGVMRGEIGNPVPGGFHDAAYSAYYDRKKPESAAMCGACHDIRSPLGGHVERTFEEWEASPFASVDAGEDTVTSCTGCHMVADPLLRPIANVPGLALPARTFAEHDFPAVDQAEKAQPPFPNGAVELRAIQSKLADSLQGALCVTNGVGHISVILDTVGLGHDFPSGAAQDRRLWTEVVAYDEGGNVLYQSGVVPDGMSPADVGKTDPDMWLLRDCMFDPQGNQVDMFWQEHTYDGNELPPIQTFNANSMAAYTSHKIRYFPKEGPLLTLDGGTSPFPAKVTLRLRLQAIGIDVLTDLVSTGDLDASVVAAMAPPIDIPLGTDASGTLTWTAAAAAAGGTAWAYDDMGQKATCVGTLLPGGQTQAPVHSAAQCSP